MGAEFAELQSHCGERREDAGYGGMQILYRQLVNARVDAVRLDTRYLLQGSRIKLRARRIGAPQMI